MSEQARLLHLFMKTPFHFALLLFVANATLPISGNASLLAEASAANFPLVAGSTSATFIVDPRTERPVLRAIEDLRHDVNRVTGVLPGSQDRLRGSSESVVIVGVAGHSELLRQLEESKKVDLRPISGSWESFIITVVKQPFPNIREALVIAGSDTRGAIYGCYEVSQAIGVSPWNWWADVTPQHRDSLFIASDAWRFGPPSVKYRGIFINDEDWGLEPWAAKTFAPEDGNIGPKTYAKVFELMLRLKANTVWPAMHPSTLPFNDFPANKDVAKEYGIIMGSSHAEAMLRNNVGEWKEPPGRYNYVENRSGVLSYWEERVRANGTYENIYTIGMRGIHDSGMQGDLSDPERIKLLEQIFADQRGLLAKYVTPDVRQIPQMFCAYKEVLDLYRGGLNVPEDVTIVWPDDNFGYIRSFANAEEQRSRSGGFGVYYHLSYLGAPMSYLWLNTTPPALVWEEMTKAYDHGAQTIWIANVGDIKPAEIGIEFFLQLAWNVKAWDRSNLPDFLPTWAAREFGPENAKEIAGILEQYFQLNFQRKPEHLQWWLPKADPRPSDLSLAETDTRLAAFKALRDRVALLESKIPPQKRDAFFELISYPVTGSALANERYFAGEKAALSGGEVGRRWLEQAKRADSELTQETERYNSNIAGGKWNRIMQLDAASNEWRQFQISPWNPPTFAKASDRKPATTFRSGISFEAENFNRKHDTTAVAWEFVPGLGRTGSGAVTLFPTTAASIPDGQLSGAAPQLEYDVDLENGGEFTLYAYLLPTHPLAQNQGLRFGIALDGEPPRIIVVPVDDGSASWAQGVLNAALVGKARLNASKAGKHTLHLFGIDPGVVIDRFTILPSGVSPGYLGTP